MIADPAHRVSLCPRWVPNAGAIELKFLATSSPGIHYF
jgi:hypothetical protein